MTNTNFSQTAAFIWSVADLLRGDFKQSQYGRVILPFTLLRRLECVQEESKESVVVEAEKVKAMPLPENAQEKMILRATNGLAFFNTSSMDLGKMGQKDIKANLERYIQCFSADVREIFEHFKFDEFVGLLNDANLLLKVVKKFATTDLSPKAVSNHEMGLVFEELIRRFAESSNETAGEHFTPRDIVRLTTSLVFMEDDDALVKEGIIRTIYDPTAGTGGFLSSGMGYVHELNPKAVMRAFGQELNPESYAICKAGMLIKGQDVSRIKLGNTLSNDQLPADKFDYMLSNPPFGVDWKKIESEIRNEHILKRFDGRFGAGLPRVSDGSLLFLMHLISKMRDTHNTDGSVNAGGRIGIILNGSPLFTGSAGSGESDIRRYILEKEDLLEAIIALPTDMFYNTGIATYVWILSNKKDTERKNKVQLIDGSNLCGKMRKSLGSKRNVMSEDDIKTITRAFGHFEAIDATSLADMGLDKPIEVKSNRGRQSANPKAETTKTFASKIFNTYEFGYRRLTIERPMRLSAQITDAAIESLRFAPKPLGAVMVALYEQFGGFWTKETYGQLSEVEVEARTMIKADFPELKEKQIKDVLENKLWLSQKALMDAARALQVAVGDKLGGKAQQSDDFNQFELTLKGAFKATDIKFDTIQKKQFIDAIKWKNQDAAPVVKDVIKAAAQPLYGTFEYQGNVKGLVGQVVEYQQDGDLRDNENVPLNPKVATSTLIETFFIKEVQPFVPDAWINADKCDNKDDGIGTVGYDINFRSYFQRNHSRDVLLRGKHFRLKEIVMLSEKGLHVLDSTTGKIIEYSNLSEQKKAQKPSRFDLSPNSLLAEFYNIFLQQDEGIDWLKSNFMTSSLWRNVSISSWLNSRISVPPISNQSELVDIWLECDAVITRVELLKKSVFSDVQSAKEQILPYQSVTSRYEQEFSSMLPTPLAILWELADSKFNERERIEAFIKTFEYLGVYLLSIIYGHHRPSKKTLYTMKGVKSLTMAFSHNRLSELRPHITDSAELVSSLCNDEITQLLVKATNLRNDIAHRGLPSAEQVLIAKDSIQSLNKTMENELRSFFEITTLIKPIQAKYDGNAFVYEVEVLKGLGVNPTRTAIIKVSEPMISGELYLAQGDLTQDESIKVTKLFPLLTMRETVQFSEIMGFYFYSDTFEGKLRFVCPYPNVETYKFLPEELIRDCLDD
jgi:type I restriction-modification system DNA methylase subunit